jgi:hypothetical protein
VDLPEQSAGYGIGTIIDAFELDICDVTTNARPKKFNEITHHMAVCPNIWTVFNFGKSPSPYMPQESINGSAPVSIFIIVAQLWKVPRQYFST